MISLILQLLTFISFIILIRMYDKKISSLEEMSESKDRYIALLEKRAREERIYKNKQFNNK